MNDYRIHLRSYDADNILDRSQLKTTNFAIIIARLKALRQLKVKHKLCVGKEASLGAVEKRDGAG